MNREIDLVREMRDVQGADGNWNFDPYMQGLYNGLEFALSLLEKREPIFRDAPEKWLGDASKKRQNFGNSEDKTQNLWAGVDFDINTKRPWVGLSETDFSAINQSCLTKLQAATSAESILKEKNS